MNRVTQCHPPRSSSRLPPDPPRLPGGPAPLFPQILPSLQSVYSSRNGLRQDETRGPRLLVDLVPRLASQQLPSPALAAVPRAREGERASRGKESEGWPRRAAPPARSLVRICAHRRRRVLLPCCSAGTRRRVHDNAAASPFGPTSPLHPRVSTGHRGEQSKRPYAKERVPTPPPPPVKALFSARRLAPASLGPRALRCARLATADAHRASPFLSRPFPRCAPFLRTCLFCSNFGESVVLSNGRKRARALEFACMVGKAGALESRSSFIFIFSPFFSRISLVLALSPFCKSPAACLSAGVLPSLLTSCFVVSSSSTHADVILSISASSVRSSCVRRCVLEEPERGIRSSRAGSLARARALPPRGPLCIFLLLLCICSRVSGGGVPFQYRLHSTPRLRPSLQAHFTFPSRVSFGLPFVGQRFVLSSGVD